MTSSTSCSQVRGQIFSGTSARRVTLCELRCRGLTNRRYIHICIRSVSGWVLVIVRLIELGGIRVESAASVRVFVGSEVLGASKCAVGHWTETRVGTMMVICSDFARCQVSRVES